MTFIFKEMLVSFQAFGSVTFELAEDPDLLDAIPPENTLKLKMSKWKIDDNSSNNRIPYYRESLIKTGQ